MPNSTFIGASLLETSQSDALEQRYAPFNELLVKGVGGLFWVLTSSHPTLTVWLPILGRRLSTPHYPLHRLHGPRRMTGKIHNKHSLEIQSFGSYGKTMALQLSKILFHSR